MGSGFSNKLLLYYLRRIVRNELSRPILLRRIVRGELSCAELSGHPIDICNLSAITMHSSKGNSSPSRNKSRTHCFSECIQNYQNCTVTDQHFKHALLI